MTASQGKYQVRRVKKYNQKFTMKESFEVYSITDGEIAATAPSEEKAQAFADFLNGKTGA